MKINKKFLTISVVLLLIFTIGIVFVDRSRLDSTNDSSEIEFEEVREDEMTTGTITISVANTLRLQSDYNTYIQGLNKALLGKIIDSDFNWDDHSYVPVSFYISPGLSYLSAELHDDKVVLTLKDAPKGCLFPQVQRLQYAFVKVPKDFNSLINKQAKLIMEENSASCPL